MGEDLDSFRLRKVVEEMGNYDLGIGVPISFSPHKHQGLDVVYYTTASEGKPAPLQNWQVWAK